MRGIAVFGSPLSCTLVSTILYILTHTHVPSYLRVAVAGALRTWVETAVIGASMGVGY